MWNIFGRKRTGQDDTLVVAGQGIQCIAQFNLRLLLATKKMHLLKQKHIAAPAILVFKGFNAVVFKGSNHLICEILCRHIIKPAAGFFLKDGMGNGMCEMAFSQPRVCQHQQALIV